MSCGTEQKPQQKALDKIIETDNNKIKLLPYDKSKEIHHL
jgi:hypothetical protein